MKFEVCLSAYSLYCLFAYLPVFCFPLSLYIYIYIDACAGKNICMCCRTQPPPCYRMHGWPCLFNPASGQRRKAQHGECSIACFFQSSACRLSHRSHRPLFLGKECKECFWARLVPQAQMPPRKGKLILGGAPMAGFRTIATLPCSKTEGTRRGGP